MLCIGLSRQDDDDDEYRQKPPYTAEERVLEYHRRGHTWPLPQYNPNTKGWAKLMNQRFEQVRAVEGTQEKWDGWIQTLNSGLTMPNFTEFGWGLTHAPKKLTEDLRAAIFQGLPNAGLEGNIDVIDGPNEPLFIDRPDLTKRVSTMDIFLLWFLFRFSKRKFFYNY